MLKLFKNIEHARILTAVDKESSFTPKFFILLVLSTIIATLGLIANNISVVIGAMIIAPLMWPILGVSLSITRQRQRHFRESILLLVASIVLSIAVAAAVSLLSPILEINGAILERTNPNIIDLVIALTTGVLATYIILTPQSDHLAGVAVAAALIPPLSAAGIAIALKDMAATKGALLLFGANLFAIILMSILILTLAGLAKIKTEEERMNITLGVIISAAMIILIAIPLGLVVKDSITTNQQESLIYKTLSSEIKIVDPTTTIASLSVDGLEQDTTNTTITANIQAPFGSTLYISDQEAITQKLSNLIGKNVILDINITPIFKAEAEPPEKEEDPFTLIIPSALGKHIPHAELISYEYDKEATPPTLNLNLQLPSHIPITTETKSQLEKYIIKLHKKTIKINLKLFRYDSPSQPKIETEEATE